MSAPDNFQQVSEFELLSTVNGPGDEGLNLQPVSPSYSILGSALVHENNLAAVDASCIVTWENSDWQDLEVIGAHQGDFPDVFETPDADATHSAQNSYLGLSSILLDWSPSLILTDSPLDFELRVPNCESKFTPPRPSLLIDKAHSPPLADDAGFHNHQTFSRGATSDPWYSAESPIAENAWKSPFDVPFPSTSQRREIAESKITTNPGSALDKSTTASGTISLRSIESSGSGYTPLASEKSPSRLKTLKQSYRLEQWRRMVQLRIKKNSEKRNTDSGIIHGAEVDPAKFVSELSNHIYTDIREFINQDNRVAVLDVVPKLLEYFPARLDMQNLYQSIPDAMYLVCKYRWGIAYQIDTLLIGSITSSEDVQKRQRNRNVMSVGDKMNMWQAIATEERVQPQVNSGSSPTQITNLRKDDSSPLDAYNKTIVESSAYQWFISHLRHESKLQRESNKSTFLKSPASIGMAILANSSSEVTMPGEEPQAYDASFQFSKWFVQGQRHSARYSADALFELITITLCAGEAQAASIKQYMSQMWPSTWEHTLLLLKDAFRRWNTVFNPRGYIVQLPDGAILAAEKKDNDLIISVTGYAYSIAEYAEQLAWLSTALRSLDQNEDCMFHCTLFNCEGAELKSFQFQGDDVTEEADSALSVTMDWWKKILGFNFSIIKGFPINSRPDSCSGIELSPDIMLKAVGISSSLPVDDDGQLKGTRLTLAFVEQRGNITLWHEPQGNQDCQNCFYIAKVSNDRRPRVSLGNFFSHRHIITPCRKNRRMSLSQTTLNYGEDLPETEPCHGSDNDNFSTSLTPEWNNFSRLKENDEKQTSCTRNDIADYHDKDSNESPIDSDMLSVSDGSSEMEFVKSEDPRAEVLQAVAAHLVAGYRSAIAGSNPSAGRNPACSAASFGQGHLPVPRKNLKHQQEKRKRNDDENSDKGNQPSPKKLKQGSGKVLACPFWKSDYIRHRCCFGRKLTRIRDVKQHLTRRHTPIYCDRCKATFIDHPAHQSHVSQPEGRTCIPSEILDGVTHQQANQLKRKSDPKLSEEGQWFIIWDILFQGRQRPNSAYMDSEVSEDIYLFRDYCRKHGEQQLREAGVLGDGSTSEESDRNLLRITLSLGLDIIFEAWLSSQSSSMKTPRKTPPDYRGRQRHLFSGASSNTFRDTEIGTGTTHTTVADSQSDPLPCAGGPQGDAEDQVPLNCEETENVESLFTLVDDPLQEDFKPSAFEEFLRDAESMEFGGLDPFDFSFSQRLPLFNTPGDACNGASDEAFE